MIAEIGQFALLLALPIAVVQALVPLLGAARNDPTLMAIAKPAAQAQFLLIAVSYAALTYVFVVSDFSVTLVANNSHSLKPMIYKVSGVWANHEGSMLMWILILAGFGAAIASFGSNLPPSLKARTLAVQAMVGIAFLAFIIFTSNPFARLDPAPLNGSGLNPLLQDPGLAFHPPLLYVGYVGFSTAFSFAVAALIEGRVDPAWGRWVRPWTLVAWTFLTGGIALGSWWAYYELGWGGWWFWDPVENASFMPWLLGTALLHSAIVVEKRDTLKSWTIFLAILTFALSLLGTFIVRSGVLTSVHSFATDPTRGVFILAILVIAVGGSLILYAWRAPKLVPGGLFTAVSREGGLVFNNLFLAVACATVLLGTLYPLVLEVISGGQDRVSVGPPFFNATFAPIMVPLVLVMAAGPYLAWKRGKVRTILGRLKFAAVAAVIAIVATFIFVPGTPLLTPFAMGLAAWLAAATAYEWADRIRLGRIPLGQTWQRLKGLPRAATGMSLAHLGVAVMIVGIAGSSSWQTEEIRALTIGQSTEVAGYDFALQDVSEAQGPNYTSQRATVDVSRDGRAVTRLYPELRFFPVAGQTTTEAAISTSLLADLYAVVGEPTSDGAYTVRFYQNPMVPWIWLGALVMVFGGFFSLSDRRHRVGAPAKKHQQQRQPDIVVGAAPAE